MARTDKLLRLAATAAGVVALTGAIRTDVQGYSPTQGEESRIYVPCVPGSLQSTPRALAEFQGIPEPLEVFEHERICIGESERQSFVDIVNLIPKSKLNSDAVTRIYNYALSQAEEMTRIEMSLNETNYLVELQQREHVNQRFLVLFPEGMPPPLRDGERFGDLDEGTMITHDGKAISYGTVGGGTRRPNGSPELVLTGAVAEGVCKQVLDLEGLNKRRVPPEVYERICDAFKINVMIAANQSRFDSYERLRDEENQVWKLSETQFNFAKEILNAGLVVSRR